METLLLFPLSGIANYSLDLCLHALHCILPAIPRPLGHAQRNSFARAELQHTLLVGIDTHATTHQRAVDLCVEILGVRIRSYELRDLDAGNEVLVRLGHEVVVSTLK